jgi:hypothetical protein
MQFMKLIIIFGSTEFETRIRNCMPDPKQQFRIRNTCSDINNDDNVLLILSFLEIIYCSVRCQCQHLSIAYLLGGHWLIATLVTNAV